eukprot:Awhi_evm1s946
MAEGAATKVSPKQEKPKFASFQLLRPPSLNGNASSVNDCIKWTDSFVISQKNNHDENGNCGSYGCRVAKLINYRMQFIPGGETPETFRIRPPVGIFRSPDQCVLFDDKMVLIPTAFAYSQIETTAGRSLTKTGNDLTFGHDVAVKHSFSFRRIHRHRPLKWSDHVLINTGFETENEVHGTKIMYVDSLNEDEILREDYKKNNPQVSSFRILAKENFAGATTECVNWGDAIELKLNNDISEEGCDNIYGCRIANVDQDGTIKFSRKTEDAFSLYVFPPSGLTSKSGCVHAGDQIQISLAQGMLYDVCVIITIISLLLHHHHHVGYSHLDH